MTGLTGRGKLLRAAIGMLALATIAFTLLERYQFAVVGLVVLATLGVALLVELRRCSQVAERAWRGARASLHELEAQSRAAKALLQQTLDWVRQVDEGAIPAIEELKGELRGAAANHQSAVVEAAARFERLERSMAAEREIAETRHSTSMTQLRRLAHEPVAQLQALEQLRFILGETVNRLPLLGGWAIDASTALLITKEIQDRRPACVVECGSGSSSVWIAEALRQTGVGRLISIEHDRHYAEVVRASLAELGLADWVEVRHAPLLEGQGGHPYGKWYDTSALSDIDAIDLLLVDGPPASTGPQARYPAMPVLASRLAPKTRIVLDDARRSDERQIVERWQDEGYVEKDVRRVQSAILLVRSTLVRD